jgi:hypothetical protein
VRTLEMMPSPSAIFMSPALSSRSAPFYRTEFEHLGEWSLVGGGGGTIRPSRGAMPVPGRLNLRDPRHADSNLSTMDAIAALDEYVETASVAV